MKLLELILGQGIGSSGTQVYIVCNKGEMYWINMELQINGLLYNTILDVYGKFELFMVAATHKLSQGVSLGVLIVSRSLSFILEHICVLLAI